VLRGNRNRPSDGDAIAARDAAPASGTNTGVLACDGQTHAGALTVPALAGLWDAGKAEAIAALNTGFDSARDDKTITIVAA
jgi:hypothetical protein